MSRLNTLPAYFSRSPAWSPRKLGDYLCAQRMGIALCRRVTVFDFAAQGELKTCATPPFLLCLLPEHDSGAHQTSDKIGNHLFNPLDLGVTSICVRSPRI